MTANSRQTQAEALKTWQFSRNGGESWASARLPHDAMIGESRNPDAAGGSEVAYFSGGVYTYRTIWRAPEKARPFAVLRFEGVQGDASVTVNGVSVGTVRSGYTESEFAIQEHVNWGEDNSITVVVDNAAQPSARWYPGSGLYRPVSIVLRPEHHFLTDGVRLRTLEVTADSATVEVAYCLSNKNADVDVTVELRDAGQVVALESGTDQTGSVMLRISNPRPWTADTPHLYELVARIESDGEVLDEHCERVGLRTIAVDARRGLQINGHTELLRGACIHHDNGPLGAATHRAAEFRRIQFLKDAGFNAIRSAHNPMSRELLDACDEIGMYVLDELADYWTISKTAHDFAWRFRDTWREDADRMVTKDRNRASVIMYASGNEIPETAKPEGIRLTQEITKYLHELDPDRPVTVAINLFLNTMVSFDKSPYRENTKSGDNTSMAGSTEANVMINQIGRMMDIVSRLPRADKASREAFANVDVAGYNYGLGRYARDARTYPERVILGSETLPGDVARAWHLVQKHDAVIGDFIWAGWEYLGEAGVSVWVPGRRAGLSKPYPYIVSGPGMFDLIGQPDITLRLAQAAWGRLDRPAIGVRPLNLSGVPMVRSAWRKTDAVESWSWRGCEGRKAEIEVYSAEDTVELFLNGRRIGRRRSGRRRGYLARFTTPYEPGILTAVAYRDGREVSRTSLQSSEGRLRLALTAEQERVTANDELIFATITICDSNNVTEMLADEQVELTVTGPGELIGYGSAAPATEESFTARTRTTYRGKALAIVRPTGEPGSILITARARSLGEAHLTIEATAVDDTQAAFADVLDGGTTP